MSSTLVRESAVKTGSKCVLLVAEGILGVYL